MRAGLAAAVIVAVLACAASAATAASATVTLTAAPSTVQSGRPVTLSGQVTPAAARSVVSLFASPYPYPVAKLLGTTTTAPSGSFSFRVVPDRNVHYRVVLAGTALAALASVAVAGKIVTKVRALPLGRAEVKLLVFHPKDLQWGGARVTWSFASGSHTRFDPVPATRTIRLSPYVAEVRTTVGLPAGRFRWRACFHAPADRALYNPRRAPGCTGWGDNGSGSLPAGFPGPGAVARGASYLATRGGRTAFAVVDTEGRMSGLHIHWTFPTASVVKAMLLVAYLRRLDAMGRRTVDPGSNSFLYPMIHISDNNAATKTWSIVGDSGLYAIAKAAGMTDFSVSGFWLTARLSPADQAHYFFEMDSLIPREFVGYARFLLSTIEPSQSWGIPVIARPLGYQTYFKDGSEPTNLGQLVHQVDRLEGHGRTFSIAVMTDGDPTMQYGIDTIQGVAAALLG
ncbi:MAG TPA: hypothetical protein VG294_16070 [Solirubrobacteraceae bacterium]|jgi:hypothetical protein|nr:hypothetical protein [Solirubrobacteraceae bacterium]